MARRLPAAWWADLADFGEASDVWISWGSVVMALGTALSLLVSA